ncbi:uncharacterized protein BJ212DRAFT_1383113 [Suillus subaureus]|uniref:Small RNA 2'-O-methyltransferase n=1 Tax=Suillus subaureus TaxID=48587 RepID=A0A9P7J8P6_9AGAM|nr:uncharacterized protein BJ212DRAFT_1383113 [Suillus subaureus]KAG1808379.1 hypothetical protein BJ212DRAFT_1383113 [Suillus subaureus]
MGGEAELRVTFFPPLYLQRRIWVLDILRREQVTEIVDIGCGEGQLLAVLCQPAPSLPPPGPGILAAHSGASPTALEAGDFDLHPTRVTGLDISSHALASAIEDTSPAAANTSYTRWESLQVNIWHGGLEIFNPAFINAECIVATEVVEHLPEEILADFAPMILGVYHPRLLLVTTPSYGFNARFSPPGLINTATGFPDPTKRTDRVFRHHDHKFEWTIEEFQEWCEGTAQEWGYDVDTTTIGRAQEKDEWGRDEELGGASQVAIFKRLEGEAWATIREEKSTSMKESPKSQKVHRLLETHHYDAHVRAGKRGSAEEIAKAVSDKFDEWEAAELRLEEIWFVEEIGAICGGWFEVLIEVIEGSPKFDLQRSKGQRRGDWPVLLVGGRPGKKKKTSEWAPEQLPDDLFEEVLQSEGYRSDDDPGFDWGSGLYSSDSGVDLLWDISKDDNAWAKESAWTCDSSDDVVDWGAGRWCTLSAAWDFDSPE